MRPVTIECETTSIIPVDKIADAFAATSSDEQAVMLQELFDALLHECGDTHKLSIKIKYIATNINALGFKQAKEGIRMMFEELQNE